MTDPPKIQQDRPDADVERDRDELLRRMLNSPPKAHDEMTAPKRARVKTKRASKR